MLRRRSHIADVRIRRITGVAFSLRRRRRGKYSLSTTTKLTSDKTLSICDHGKHLGDGWNVDQRLSEWHTPGARLVWSNRGTYPRQESAHINWKVSIRMRCNNMSMGHGVRCLPTEHEEKEVRGSVRTRRNNSFPCVCASALRYETVRSDPPRTTACSI